MASPEQAQPTPTAAKRRPRPKATEVSFSSNAVRLSGPQWVIAGALVVALCLCIPSVWDRLEAFEPGPDYRIPYDLGNDYWLYTRYCRRASAQDKILVIGDSVVWGEYVTPQDTLTHHLNELAGADRFANLGVDGIHPAALAGLIAYYGRAVSGQDVILHYNPLWMSSERRDLQTEKEFRFNHPKLVPQFVPSIPCYKEPYADRIGIVVERYLPLRAWTDHLAVAYFDNTDLPTWARENPYGNPFKRITLELPAPGTALRHKPVAWTESGITPVNFDWVEPATSLQWRLFQRAVRTLQDRNNHLFVLVGPFNEHMIEGQSLEAYRAIKSTIETWLKEQQIPHYVPPRLPSDLYADASHPLGEGYALLAKQIFEHDSFKKFRESQSLCKNHRDTAEKSAPEERENT